MRAGELVLHIYKRTDDTDCIAGSFCFAEAAPHAAQTDFDRRIISMKRSFWRVLVLTAAAAVLLAGGPAAAVHAAQEDTIDTGRTGSIVIHKYDITGAESDGVDVSGEISDGLANAAAEDALQDYAIEGVEFTYLKVSGIRTEPEDGRLRVIYDLPEDLAGIVRDTGGRRFTGDELNDAMQTLMSGDGRTAAKNSLEDYIAEQGGTAMELTDAQGLTEESGLPLGLYLIVETMVPENVMSSVDPFFVSLPMTDPTGDRWIYDVSAYPKNQTDNPTLEKEVRSQDDRENFAETATASEGDVLEFRILSEMPRITSKATYLSRYDYDDAMCAGVKYNEDTQIRFYGSRKDAEAEKNVLEVWEKGSPDFSVAYTEPGTDGRRHMKIGMSRQGLEKINPAFSEAVMEIRYTGTLQSNADTIQGTDGNPNDVELTWSRTNKAEYDTLTDQTKTFTFGINLQKRFSDEQGDPEKVQFILHNDTDGYYVTAKSENGLYYVDGKAESEKDATALSPKADGWLDVCGVEAEDDFTLTEIRTDHGYTLLRDPVKIHIDQEGTAIADSQEAVMVSRNGQKNAAIQLGVLNTRDVNLPRTGGRGTLLFTLAGGAAVLLGIMMTSGRRRQRREDA